VEEVNEFAAVYFKPRRKSTVHDHAAMNRILDRAVERFKALDEEKREAFKSLVVGYRNMYAFLSQVIPYQDTDLEKLYTYLRFLLTKLPRRASGPAYHFEDEIELQYYRLQKISEGRIDLGGQETKALKGPGDVGTGRDKDKEVLLSDLIDVLNERFGTDFKQADQLFFDQIREEAMADKAIYQAAQVNTIDDFRLVFEKAFEGLAIDRMEGNEEIFGRLMGDAEFRRVVSDDLLHKIFNEINTAVGLPKDVAVQLSDLKSKAAEYLRKHLGSIGNWPGINQAIWHTMQASSDVAFFLQDIDKVSRTLPCEPNEVLAILALLSRPSARLIKMDYLRDDGDRKSEISPTEVGKKIKAWWKDKTLSDADWEAWAITTHVRWTPRGMEKEAS
jgi:hypothetical protein